MEERLGYVMAVIALLIAGLAFYSRSEMEDEEIACKLLLVDQGKFDYFWAAKNGSPVCPVPPEASPAPISPAPVLSFDAGVSTSDSGTLARDAGFVPDAGEVASCENNPLPMDNMGEDDIPAPLQRKKSAFDMSSVREWSQAYTKLGRATVLIRLPGSLCHGVIGEHHGEIVIYTAAHCVKSIGPEGGEIHQAKYYSEGKTGDRSYYYVGFGYLKGDLPAAVFSSSQVWATSDRVHDTAVIRVPEIQNGKYRDLAIELATALPEPGEDIYSTHWQDWCWKDSKVSFMQFCIEGQLLIPTLGRSLGTDGWGYAINLPVYGGDSGSGVVDAQGRLIGLVSRTSADKANEAMITIITSIDILRQVLEESRAGSLAP